MKCASTICRINPRVNLNEIKLDLVYLNGMTNSIDQALERSERDFDYLVFLVDRSKSLQWLLVQYSLLSVALSKAGAQGISIAVTFRSIDRTLQGMVGSAHPTNFFENSIIAWMARDVK